MKVKIASKSHKCHESKNLLKYFQEKYMKNN